ncbi:MAG: HAD-IA family hydrolase [Hyphomicrobiales bacterium]
MIPALFTFDVFGTVLDWRRGLAEAVRAAGVRFDEDAFDRVIDAQAEIEAGPFRSYAAIVAESLVRVLGMAPTTAAAIGASAGRWPLYPDSAAALRGLLEVAPCVAMTNSDRAHGAQVQEGLGFPLSDWICAEEIGRYKPDPAVWHAAAARLGVPADRRWWHVSAYGDYDLETARSLGLTCVYVERPHARPGPADVTVPDLMALLERVRRGAAGRGPGRDLGPGMISGP